MSDPRVEFAGNLERLREGAAHCTECPLYENATQTVFGEGPHTAAVMLVGEQPIPRRYSARPTKWREWTPSRVWFRTYAWFPVD